MQASETRHPICNPPLSVSSEGPAVVGFLAFTAAGSRHAALTHLHTVCPYPLSTNDTLEPQGPLQFFEAMLPSYAYLKYMKQVICKYTIAYLLPLPTAC